MFVIGLAVAVGPVTVIGGGIAALARGLRAGPRRRPGPHS
jgi:hypothetical protein